MENSLLDSEPSQKVGFGMGSGGICQHGGNLMGPRRWHLPVSEVNNPLLLRQAEATVPFSNGDMERAISILIFHLEPPGRRCHLTGRVQWFKCLSTPCPAACG